VTDRETAEPDTTHLWWDSDGTPQRLDDPSADDLWRRIAALDGHHHSYVSLLRGDARLDVAGSASALMVFQSESAHDHRSVWHHLTSADAALPDGDVVVRAGGLDGHFPRSTTTSREEAVRAGRHFLATGARDPGLTWRGDRGVADMRHPVLHGDPPQATRMAPEPPPAGLAEPGRSVPSTRVGRGARYWVLAVLCAVVGTALVVVLYDRGVLPIAGPFVLLALMPLLWPLFERGQRVKAEREARKRDP
jgi:hypothetical protein